MSSLASGQKPAGSVVAAFEPDLIVVGSGFFGSTIANLVATRLQMKVLVIEKRDHIGGNSFSYKDTSTGIEIHKYGTHLFHTSNKKVWDYVNQFAEFNSYKHTVWSTWQNQVLSMPINLDTICQVFGRAMTPSQAKDAVNQDIKQWELNGNSDANLESKAISLVGPTLYKALIEGYTKKQWQTDPKALPSEIITRLPVRFDFNNRYFNDQYEGLPTNGYGNLFAKMLSHENIRVELQTDFFTSEWKLNREKPIVFTGPLDQYFGYSEGELRWRTIDFEWATLPVGDAQGCSVMNFADEEVPYTRIHEFKHLHPEREVDNSKTVIAKEFSRWATTADEPYYPVNGAEDRSRLLKYRELAASEPNVVFGGRLGTYQYLDMHMSIASALATFESKVAGLLLG